MEAFQTSRLELPSGAILYIVREYTEGTYVRTCYQLESKNPLPFQLSRKLQSKAEKRVKAYQGLVFNPALLLSGSWMAKAGFRVGDQVTVTVDDGLIIITH
ncbi:hypothetical protein GCM10027275_42820 [Rhabdobacter roseus]|uniref:Toxin SymE-like domain-containing protein n=1 Tax=Rhabdobacter roseus TaxID=1655419 RepID=A0A840TTR4_9BACT|nr:SymE family type I addiction module toxin [Rhabdobacter roseus]MBB5286664.1 hypothetical protein [Rhabdobacter roseus]